MQLEIEIEKMATSGCGVGQDADKNVYFVRRALPGDKVKIEVPEKSKRYKDATLLEVLRPSSDRIPPVCNHFNECGGCDYLNWDYKEQLAAKENSIRHALNRISLKCENFLPILPSPLPLHYRRKIQIRKKGNDVGFFKHQTRQIVSIESCHTVHPKINEALQNLKKEPASNMTKYEISLDEDENLSVIENKPHSFGGFIQVNHEQNLNLRRLVKEWVSECGSQMVLELFCGNGNLTQAYKENVSSIVCVDFNEHSLVQSDEKITSLCDRIDPLFYNRLPSKFKNQYDTLLVDPPRTGLGKEVLKSFVHKGLKWLIYVSCSPISFTQDLRELNQFTLKKIQPLDMFPQTKHVELVALLSFH